MSWFEEQLRYREESDNADFEDAIDSIANAVMGTRLRDAVSQKEITSSVIDEILKFYHCSSKQEDLPPKIETIDEQIEYRLRPFGIKSRSVTLEKGWYKYAIGAMIGTLKEDGSAVALIPGKFTGYKLIDFKNGKQIPLNRKTEQLLDPEALCFYEPLPQKSLTIVDLLKFMVQQLSISDIVWYLVLMGLSAALGLLSPLFTKWLFGDVLESGSLQVLLSLAVFVLCFTITRVCFSAYQGMFKSRIEIKQNIAVQSAVMNRIISLPATFFKQYSAGELYQRSAYVQSLCANLFNAIGMTGLTSIFSLIYIGQIFAFAPSLVVPSLVITLAMVVLSLITTFLQIKVMRLRMETAAKTSGLTYATITGIQKIKLAGAEKRMFSRWARHYAKDVNLEYNPPTFFKISETISLALSLIGTMILYATAIKTHVAVADYYAFSTAYGMVSAAFLSVASIAINVANIRPTLEMAKPIMETEPEKHDGKENIAELQGSIELSHISFRYDESMPYVIEDLSLKVHPGEYLAVVGSTGCGKSTLMRLLLGFETPQKGSIFFDRKDLAKIDLESLRRKIGVVMQDGKLFLGDIYSNIVITAPELGMDAAWEAAEIASIAEDIRSMPMGMHTIISEGQGGISGGQRQRLMIARAVAPKPKILMFDEATSALDNITQKKVSEAIDQLKCTRIVIAHRLSTIQHADRIIYLEKGTIVEEGTYEELIEKNGYFAKLVERQRLDIEE
ncbi:MAG: NHLP bacteriocin export ABC transporter permease/ATPase subunit [Lachnospiraceae bacterium]|nr:NHLP bacteriocin export ABC transporter permease/ATPase subunit [Lachnospiraceae bacterium]